MKANVDEHTTSESLNLSLNRHDPFDSVTFEWALNNQAMLIVIWIKTGINKRLSTLKQYTSVNSFAIPNMNLSTLEAFPTTLAIC